MFLEYNIFWAKNQKLKSYKNDNNNDIGTFFILLTINHNFYYNKLFILRKIAYNYLYIL